MPSCQDEQMETKQTEQEQHTEQVRFTKDGRQIPEVSGQHIFSWGKLSGVSLNPFLALSLHTFMVLVLAMPCPRSRDRSLGGKTVGCERTPSVRAMLDGGVHRGAGVEHLPVSVCVCVCVCGCLTAMTKGTYVGERAASTTVMMTTTTTTYDEGRQ